LIRYFDKIGEIRKLYYRSGLYNYFDRQYPLQFRTVSLTYNLTYNLVLSEINANRPGTILYWGHPYYGEHYVTLVGYQYDTDGSNEYYIIYDTWSRARVYRLFYSDVSYFSEYSSIARY